MAEPAPRRRCERFEPLLSAWIDDELRAGERGRLAAHLQGCARCRSDIHALRVTRGLLQSMPPRVPVDVDLGGRVQPDVLVSVAPGRRGQARVRRAVTRSLAGAAAALCVLGAAAFYAGADPDEDVQLVSVPVEVFVGDHLVRSVGGTVSSAPVILDGRP